MRFTDTPMVQIIDTLRARLGAMRPGERVAFEVLDPDRGSNAYAGTRYEIDGMVYIYRGYKAWTDLAELLGCRMLTPERSAPSLVTLRFEKLDLEDSFHAVSDAPRTEKYGTASRFAAICKNEEPAFVDAYAYALRNAEWFARRRVLNLGINSAEELEVMRHLDPEAFESIEVVGIDHSASAIAEARARFPQQNVTFIEADINRLGDLNLGRFDLIVSIGTLQSPGVDFKPLFMSLVQEVLEAGGAIILGFPNCRWQGGEMIYGAKAPNYPYSEQSLLYKDVTWCKKYLQQKKFRVTLTGKPYLFLKATAIGS